MIISHSNIVHAVVGTKDRLLTYLPNGKMAGHVFQVRCRPYRQEGSRLEPAWRARAQHNSHVHRRHLPLRPTPLLRASVWSSMIRLRGAPHSRPSALTLPCGVQAYLPLAHIMEMVLEIACVSHGVVCGYGNPHTLTPAGIKLKTGTCQGDAATLRPTMMVFAPAILDKVQVALHAKISSSSPIVQTLFKWGLAAGESNFFQGVVGAPWYYNKIVFKKVQALLGGRVVFAATGSAPLAPQTQRFIQTAFNAPTRQGYGLTETCATSCIQVTRRAISVCRRVRLR